MKNGNAEGLGILADRGIGIRVLVDGGMGFASTNVLTKESVAEAVKKAVKLAKAASKVRNEPIRFSEEDFHEVYYEVKMRKDFRDIPPEEKRTPQEGRGGGKGNGCERADALPSLLRLDVAQDNSPQRRWFR